MRKSSKLLAVLLTLCLLFGAITAIFVSANETEAEPVGGDENASSGATLTGNSNPSTGGGSYAAARDLAKYDFVTVDLDITPAGDNGEYHPGMLLQPNYILVGTTSHKTMGGIYVVKSGDYYYASAAKNVADVSDATRLSATPGVYDHFTFVLEVTHTGEGDEMVASSVVSHIYVNGKYLTTDGPFEFTTGVSYSRFSLKKPTGTGAFDAGCGVTYKINVAKYNVGGDKANALGAIVDAKTPLYNTTSNAVFYNANYVTPDAETNYVEINTTKYTLIGMAEDAMATLPNDAKITLSGKSLVNVTIPDGVRKFTVECKNGAKFELSETSKANFIEENGVYTFSKQNITVTEDFSDYTDGETNALNRNPGNSVTGFGYNNSAKSIHLRATYVNSAYVRLHYDKDNNLKQAVAECLANNGTTTVANAAHMEREAEAVWRAHGTYNAKTDISNFKYMTLDFDFGTDAYAYTFTSGGETYYATAKTEAEAIAKLASEQGVTLTEGNYDVTFDLAYPAAAGEELTFRPQFISSTVEVPVLPVSTAATHTMVNGGTISVYKSGDDWYVGSSTRGSVKLSGEIDVYDHVTYVYEIATVNDVTTMVPHVYVNGEYLFSFDTVTEHDGAAYNHFQQLMINFGKSTRKNTSDKNVDNPSFKMYDRYSFAFDNMAVTYYDELDLENTTLDENINANTEVYPPLYTLEGVVYNEGYVTPNTDRYATLDDDVKYYVIGAAFNKLEDCGTIYLHNVGKYELPASLALNEFTAVVYEGDYEYSEADAEKYVITKDGTVYAFVLARSYVLVDDVEYTLEEALPLLASANKLELVRTSLENFDAYEAGVKKLTVIADEYSNFSLAADIAWRYANVNGTYVCAIDGMPQANLTLASGSMNFKIYLPLSETGTLSLVQGYTSLTGTGKDGNIKNGGTYVYNGQEYLVVYWATRMDMSGKTIFAEFKYTDENGNEAILGARYKAVFDTIEYAKIVAESTTLFPCGGEAAQLVKAMTDYRVQTMTAFGKSTTAFSKAYDAFAKHPNCQCGNIKPEGDYIEVGQKQENFAFPEGVSVSYGISGNLFAMLIDSTKGTVVEISYTNYDNKADTATAQIINGRAAIGTHAADIDNKFTITILNVEGEGEDAVTTVVAEFTYSLADYTPTTDADAAIIAALKNYALASENYKNDPKEN